MGREGGSEGGRAVGEGRREGGEEEGRGEGGKERVRGEGGREQGKREEESERAREGGGGGEGRGKGGEKGWCILSQEARRRMFSVYEGDHLTMLNVYNAFLRVSQATVRI